MIPNTRKPMVSILMPFYNAGTDFEAALRSILNQAYSNWELLLCDDGSTDGSLALAHSFRDPRIHIWSDGERKGLAKRLNECIDRAKGELMARMDADDLSYPERLQSQVEFLSNNPQVDLVGCQMLIFGEDGAPLGLRRLPLQHEKIVAHPHLGFGLAHPTWVARAEWFRKYRYDWTALRYEDVELLYRAHKGSRFANLPEILYGYREMRGGFRKRLKTRMGRVRYLKSHKENTGRVTFYRAAISEAVKIVSDAALVATSTRYAMLRRRESSLSTEQIAHWHKTLEINSGNSSRSRKPVRLMVLTTIADTLETFFSRQLCVMAENGFEVHGVCSPGGHRGTLNDLEGVAVHRLSMERQPHPVDDCVSIFRLLRLMRRVRPDIVHAHTPKAGLLSMVAAKVMGTPVRLYTIHGLPLMTRKGIWRRVLQFVEQATCAMATQVYAVSPSLQTVISEMKLCPADKLSTLGDGSCSGIDLERFSPSEEVRERGIAQRLRWGIPKDALLLSFVGRIAHDKGITTLAEAWNVIAREFSQSHLLLAGMEDLSDPAPPEALERLRRDNRVHFTNEWVRDMPALYSATDVVVVPTLREGLSQVALEAGAMRVPIVSTRIPGVITAVQDGLTGILVPPRETTPLIEAIEKLMNGPDLRAELGAAAREYVRTHFCENRVNQLWVSEYQKLLQTSHLRPVNGLAQIETPR
jgi:glycosyltransferase involved in cell wall biosynthesis